MSCSTTVRAIGDLGQRAVQRLFAHGLALQGAASRPIKSEVRQMLEAQITELDTIIHDIRDAVFSPICDRRRRATPTGPPDRVSWDGWHDPARRG